MNNVYYDRAGGIHLLSDILHSNPCPTPPLIVDSNFVSFEIGLFEYLQP